jgi:very-short-patch-repair endonuclease
MRDPRLVAFAKQMRREMTVAEKRLWQKLRAKRFLDTKFRAQNVVGPYIADFYARDVMLVIEVDGDSHAWQHDYDEVRTRYLEGQGYSVIRVWNDDVMRNMDAVLELIFRYIERFRAAGETPPLPGASHLSLSPEGERAA